MSWKRLVVSTVLGGAVLVGGVLLTPGTAQAQIWGGSCRQRVDREEWNLQRDIERHGYYSRQANHRRHELSEARANCGREQGRRWDRDGNRGRDDDRRWRRDDDRRWRRDRDDRWHQQQDNRWHGRNERGRNHDHDDR